MANLVGLDITMANNINAFLTSLATENHTSKAQVQILLAKNWLKDNAVFEKFAGKEDRALYLHLVRLNGLRRLLSE